MTFIISHRVLSLLSAAVLAGAALVIGISPQTDRTSVV